MTEDTEIKVLLDWIAPEKESQKEIEQKANAYETFYKSYFEKDLKRIMLEHLIRKDKYASNLDDISLNKGIMAGLELIKKHFEGQQNISLSRFEE